MADHPEVVEAGRLERLPVTRLSDISISAIVSGWPWNTQQGTTVCFFCLFAQFQGFGDIGHRLLLIVEAEAAVQN